MIGLGISTEIYSRMLTGNFGLGMNVHIGVVNVLFCSSNLRGPFVLFISIKWKYAELVC